MVFSTLLLLFRFLPITLALWYYLRPPSGKTPCLFVCSTCVLFLGRGAPVPHHGALAILINPTAGLGMEKVDIPARAAFLPHI